MIEITVDYNQNIVIIHNDSYNNDFEFDVGGRPIYTLKVLEELLTHLSNDRGDMGWVLIKVDEDTRTIVGEW